MRIYSEIIFPRCFDWVIGHQGFESARQEALSRVRGRILEVGIGTGRNLDFYPRWVKHITAIEPNLGMQSELWKRSERHPIEVECCAGTAEHLPFASASFETVVSSFTMCSISDRAQALAEISRVLAPGGRFVFLEHGISRDLGVALAQHLLNPLQGLIGCGCHLTVDVPSELRRAGFSVSDFKAEYVGPGPKILGYLFSGVAWPHAANTS